MTGIQNLERNYQVKAGRHDFFFLFEEPIASYI